MAQKKQSNRRFYGILTLITLIIVLPLLYLLLAAFGERSGVEFSPDDFSFRSFKYNKLPLINYTRRGIEYSPIQSATSANADTLVKDDLIRATGRVPKRWHLTSETGGKFWSDGIPTACDARFLTDYFYLTNDDGKVSIMQWTDDNPKSAKIYWPLIAEMARHDLYLPIPGLMEFVLEYPEPDKPENFDGFEAALLKRVGEAWYEAGITDQLKNSHERAIERFEIALTSGDGHPEAQQAKETSESASP